MGVELAGAKMLAPFYGTSLYVWAAVLSITVLGLSMGYWMGGKCSQLGSRDKILTAALVIGAITVFFMTDSAKALISLTRQLPLLTGICISAFFLIVPPMFTFGVVGPLLVRIMTQTKENIGKTVGKTYFLSTFGGVVATFLFGYVWIPQLGLNFSTNITALSLGLAGSISVLYQIFSKKNTDLNNPVHESNFSTINISGLSRNLSKTRSFPPILLFAAIEGSAVMAVELLGARMLAPYFGASLYVWATVIGITLSSLALGYYVGGRLADKYPGVSTIHWVMLSAGACILLLHITANYLTLALSDMQLKLALLPVSLALLVPSLFCLGMVPTLLIKHISHSKEDAGRATGWVFTLSSLSGVFMLPVLGFAAIPRFGISGPSIFVGMLVGVVSLIYLLRQRQFKSLTLVAILLLSINQRAKTNIPEELKLLHYSEGLLGQVIVADLSNKSLNQNDHQRILFVNRMGQTNVNLKTKNSNWTYIPFSISAASVLPAGSDALLLGLGGGSVANYLNGALGMNVDAVELDERIAKIALKYFELLPSVNVITDDARHYIESTDKKYDLVFIDVFKGDVMPAHVLSLECFKTVKHRLNTKGIVIVNFNGFLSGEAGLPARSLFATLNEAGFLVDVLPTPEPENKRNLLFLASVEKQEFVDLRSPLKNNGVEIPLPSLFLDREKVSGSHLVLKDNCPKLDRINVEAGLSWRNDYNLSYNKYFSESGIALFK